MAGREKASWENGTRGQKKTQRVEKECQFFCCFGKWQNYRWSTDEKVSENFGAAKQGPGARRNRARAQGKTGPGRKAKQGPGTRQNRAGCKAKQGRMQTPGLQAKIPFDGKRPKMPLKAFFLIWGYFPVLLNTELKTGILTGLRRSRGDYDIPLSKVTTEKRPAGIDRALFCWTEGIMKAITHSRFRYRFRRLR